MLTDTFGIATYDNQPDKPRRPARTRDGAEQFPVGVFRTDRNGICFAVNPRWCELSGLSEEQSMGLGWASALHPDDRARVAREQASHLAAGQNLRIEFRLVHPDGTTVWVLSQAVGSYAEDGTVDGFVGTITDITARVRAEEALRESEERFRNLVELSPDFIAIHRGGIMGYVNEAGLQMMRALHPADLVGITSSNSCCRNTRRLRSNGCRACRWARR